MTRLDLDNAIDAALNDSVADGSISPSIEATNIKLVADYVDQEISTKAPDSFYSGIFSQSSIAPPSGTTIKKTFAGNLTWSYQSTGTYILTSSISLSGLLCVPFLTNGSFPSTAFTLVQIGDAFRLRTYDVSTGTPVLTDGALTSFSMKIEFYTP